MLDAGLRGDLRGERLGRGETSGMVRLTASGEDAGATCWRFRGGQMRRSPGFGAPNAPSERNPSPNGDGDLLHLRGP
jgi:hypothetical protein